MGREARPVPFWHGEDVTFAFLLHADLAGYGPALVTGIVAIAGWAITFGTLRQAVAQLTDQFKTLEKRVTDHGERLSTVEGVCETRHGDFGGL